MYEKEMNLLNNDDRKIYSLSFRYNAIFAFLTLVLIISSVLLKKDCYYQSIIKFVDSKKSLILVDKNYLESVKNSKSLILNDVNFDYSIDKIEESEENYLVTISFKENLKINHENYRIYLGKERIIRYILRIMRGGI